MLTAAVCMAICRSLLFVHDVLGVVQQEAIIISAIMAEIMVAVPAVPHCLVANVVIVVAVVTPSSFLCSPCRKMSLAESFHRGSERGTTRSLPTAIVSNEAPG